MIKRLTNQDIEKVVKLHKQELPGFLSEVGEEFLKKFYEVSLSIPEIFTYVAKEDEQILGFVSSVSTTKGLHKKIILKDIVGFATIFLRYFIAHPEKIVKVVKTGGYPGFSNDSPELLTIAIVKKYQRKGIGSKLFKKTAAEFKKRGFKKFKVSVYDKLPVNQFYKKMGCQFEKSFIFLGEKMNYYSFVIPSPD